MTNRLGALVVGLQDPAMGSGYEGLSASSVATVLTLLHWEPLSVTEVAAVVGLSHSAAVRVVDGLVRGSLVDRGHGLDGRTVGLTLSTEGQRVAAEIQQRRIERLTAAVDCLSASEHRSLDQLVSKVLGGLPASVGDARHICRFCDHTICSGRSCPVGEAGRAIGSGARA